MIRERTLSSQLEEFRYRVVTLRIASDHEGERFEYDAKGRETMEVGWRGVSPDTDPDDDANGDDAVAEHSVPLLKIGAKLVANSGAVVSHTAHPPTRYTEASLIRQLELLGIGRPSTFAAIVTHLINCGYLVSNDGALTPTDDAFAIVDTLCGRFSFVESEYTRELEDRLDQIAEGIKDYRSVVLELDRTLDQELSSMEQQAPRYPCPSCGRPLRLIDGRHGQFWGCTGYSEGCSVTCQDRDGRPGDPSAQEHQPSEKAIAYAQKLACEIQAVIPTETLASARLLGQWIEEALKGQAQRPATAKQKETIQSLVARNHLDLPSAGLDSLSMRDASVFIAHHAHNRQRSPDRRTGGASRSRNVAARPSIGTSASDTRARARAMRSRRRRRHQ
jgi:DNA topoisomerase-1